MDERVAQLIRQGQGAAQRGNNELAREYLQAAVDLAPNNPTAWLWLAGVLEDPAEAKYALERVLELDPNNVRAREGLTQLAATMGAQAAEQRISFEQTPQSIPRGTSALGGGGSLSIEQELRTALQSQPSAQPMALPSPDDADDGGGSPLTAFFRGDDMPYRVGVAFLSFMLVCGFLFFFMALFRIV